MRRALVLALALAAGPVAAQQSGPVVLPPARALTQPLLAPDANTAIHVGWRDGAMVVYRGPAWTQNGTVPQVSRTASTTAGAGPCADAAYYSQGTGNDVLDFAGDFSAYFVLAPSSADLTGSGAIPFSNGLFTSAGFFWQWNPAGAKAYFSVNWAGAQANTQSANSPIAGQPNVVCLGRSGTTIYVQLNLGSMSSTAGTTILAGTSQVARLGRYEGTGRAMTGTLYEVVFSSTAITPELCTAAAQRVKQRLGLTAW